MFTPTGTAVADQARTLLAGWQGQVNDARHRIGKTKTRSHPLNLLWQAFADEVASGRPYLL